MDVELLVVGDCPHEALAAQRLREALDAIGLESLQIDRIVVASEDEARTWAFHGSPSFRFGGRDPFPVSGPPSVSCRIYSGVIAEDGIPAVPAIRRALEQAAEAARGCSGSPVTSL